MVTSPDSGEVLEKSAVSGSGEIAVESTEEDALSREFCFEDEVFVGSEKNKGPKKTTSEKWKRQYEHARAKRVCDSDL